MDEDKKEQNLNVCIIGHVDSGKSTTVGNLACQLKVVDERSYNKLQSIAAEKGKGSFSYAYIFDKTETERSRGITVDATMVQFRLKYFPCNIIDCPGHKDFIKNMVTGAAQADVAVAMVPGSDFAAAVSAGATLKDHILISGVMGVKKLIIAINKMDCFPPAEQKAKFNEISDEMRRIAKTLHSDKDPIIIPISGFKGINIIDAGEKFEWFSGWQDAKKTGEVVYTLEGALNSCKLPDRPVAKPLRMPVTDIHTIKGIGTIYTGRVDSGFITPNTSILIQPANIAAEVKSLQIFRKDQKVVSCGQNVGLAIKSGAKGNLTQIKKGNVISDPKNKPCQIYYGCKATVVVVGYPKGIKPGYTPVMDLGTHHVPVRLAGIISIKEKKKDPKEVAVVNTETPTIIKNRQSANCVLIPQKPVVMESSIEYPSLGRFALRDGGAIVAMGSIQELLTKESIEAMGYSKLFSKEKAADAA